MKKLFHKKIKSPQKVDESAASYTFRHYSDAAYIQAPAYNVPAALADKEQTIWDDCVSFLKHAGFDRYTQNYYDYELETIRNQALASLDIQRIERLHVIHSLKHEWAAEKIRIEHDQAQTEAALKAATERLQVLQAIQDKGTVFEELSKEDKHHV
jgi:hypothetical protein